MGATSRLVITPLTDKCWITITGAIHIKLGANPVGPAGTGKTESTKDLAKAIGMQCIVFNCSDQVDYKMMGRLFSGLAQQGCWTCLDEFNRIDIEVLSVIAQQLATIRNALLRSAEEFTFEGIHITLVKTVAVCVTMNPGYAGRTELPDNLKVLFRPVSMMIPDYGLIAEIMLFAEGFDSATELSKKMVKLYKLASEQLSQQDHYDFGMRAVKSVLVMAGALKRANPDMKEDAVLIRAMRDSNVPKFLSDDLPLFGAIVQDLFPTVVIKDADYGDLQKQIEASIKYMVFQPVPEFITKVIQLFDTFEVRFGVMIVGPTGAGKTTCYRVLQHAMTELRQRNTPDDRFQNVETKVLNPKSITMGELYGEVNPISQEWTDGLASKIMRTAAGEQGNDRTWVVFDGPVDALWIENMNTVLDDNMTLCLANGQRLKLRHQMRMLFEVQDLAVASPATVSRCGMVYMTPEDLSWRPYIKSRIATYYKDESILDDFLKQYLYETFDQTIDQGLERISNGLIEPVPTVPVQRATNVMNFLEAFLRPEYGFKGNREVKQKLINSIFVWCYAWGMGGALDQFGKERLDDTIKDIFKSVKVPSGGTSFDYWYEANKKEPNFVAWNDKVPVFEYDGSLPYFQLMVPTVDTYRYAFLLEMLYTYSTKPIFFTGVSGVGKSIIIQNSLNTMKEPKGVQTININFSAQTTSLRTQQTIEDKLEKKRRTLFGAGPGKSIAVFVDDVNMPAVEEYGAQPPIELLRLFVDRSGLYDRADLYWKDVEDTTLICCAAPPGGGRNPTTPRFVRHFNVFCLPTSSKEVLQKIFNSILGGFIKSGFNEEVRKLQESCVDSTIDIYTRIAEELRPTPARFHYLFNLRDVSRVIQGILMVKPVSCQSPETLSRLWVNEMSRVFKDRLIDEHDREWFNQNVTELVNSQFRIRIEKDELFGSEPILWGDLLKLDAPVKLYEEISNKTKLFNQLEASLDDYNMSNTGKMNLVFFDDCMDHILRISRILRQPRGNAMMIGVGGSGKQSATRLASYMLEIEFKQIEITKRFGPAEFKEFLKELMFTTGIDRTPICFTLTDTQIISELFVEDINSILNTGEVSNLMEPEDKDKIVEGVRPIMAQLGRVDTLENIQATFVEGVRDYLHINLCMSPVGDTLRVRCRMFPSLVNCCTLDWFSRWPESALYYVSSAFLKDLTLKEEENRKALAEMCMIIHTTVEDVSEDFWRTLRRRVYTTPKSYLDLINLYLSALEQKRTEFNINKTRLATGIKKLTDTNTNIAELREQIKELQPQLQKKNEDLKVSLKKATEDRKIADEKEEVVSKEAEIVNKQADEAQIIVDDVQAELNQVQPELDAAQASLLKLDKSKITEIKSFPNPPEAVVMVMEAVMIVFGEKTEWNHVKKVISDPKAFVDSMKSFDAQTLDQKKLNLLRKKYINRKDFVPSEVESKSVAAKSMCEWVLALDKYAYVLKKVGPKKEKYNEVSKVLKVAKEALAVKQAELKEVTDKVAALEAACLSMEEEKRQLEENMDRCEKRMGRAEKLVVLLEDEGVRWKETVEMMEKEIDELVGNVFISAACISYFGAFTGTYREKLISKWMEAAIAKQIPVAESFDLIKIMGDPVTIRGWGIASLPTDQVSVENGILATQAQRWPLMIDPEEQANKWIKNIGKEENLEVLRFSTPNFLRTLGGAVSIGRPVLVEDIGETLDPGIDPILLKQVFKSGSGIKQIRIGDSNLDYDDNFKFYMTTKLPNPHYLPEACIKVTLINFSVTFKGLEDQMLGDVVVQEKPEVEKKRDEVVVTMDKDQRTLKQIEITILKLLSESQIEEILDEDNLINILEDSKKTSREISARIEQAVEVEHEINETRNQYKSVAVRGSVLYFVIADLSKIDPMYQYSLVYIKRLFNSAIKKSESKADQQERIDLLISNITKTLYTSVARGLFEADKITFSFLISTSINRQTGNIQEDTWRMLLIKSVKIPSGVTKKQRKNPDKENKYLTTITWDMVFYLDTVLARDF